jgi:spore coat protein U-like protein
MKRSATFLALLVSLVLAVAARAGNCTSITVTNVVFGNYSVYSTQAIDVEGSVSVTCTPNTVAKIAITAGSSGTFAQRRMPNGTSYVYYNLFTNGTRSSSTIWGDGSPGATATEVQFAASEPGAKTTVLPIYARAYAGADATVGTHTDLLSVRVTWSSPGGGPGGSGALAAVSLTASTTVIAQCSMTTQDLDFGAYDPLSANFSSPLRNSAAKIVVKCTRGATGAVGLNLGSNASGTTRRMAAGGGNFLTYELYRDATYSSGQIWSSTNRKSAVSTGKDNPLIVTGESGGFTIFGQVPGGQVNAASGSYSDTITATVNY